MAGSLKANKQVFVFPSLFLKQADFLTPLTDGALDARHPQINGTFADILRTRSQRFECNDIDLLEEEIQTEYARKRFQFAGTAEIIGGWLAMSYGSATAPSGTPTAEVQTLTASGTITAGTYKVILTIEGVVGTSKAIPYNANAATVQAYLNKISTIRHGGSVTVTGTLVGGFTVTFGGNLGNANIPAFTVNNSGLTGGTVVVATTTQGTSRTHSIARSVSDELPYTSFIEGFIGDTTDPIKWFGFAVDVLTIEATKGGDLLVTVELVGRSDYLDAVDFVIPDCVNAIPISVKQCRIKVDGSFISSGLTNFRFERRNNIVTSAEAFAFDSELLETNERGERPTETLSFGYQGSRGDSTYSSAEAELNKEVIAYLGALGARAIIAVPECNLKLASPAISFDGALRKSVVNIEGQPYFDETLGASSAAEIVSAHSTTYLDTE